MKKVIIYIFIFLINIFLLSCEDEIQLEIQSQKPELVVYGEINNGRGPYRVRLQKPTSYGNLTVRDFNPPPVENATVTISDNYDNAETLIEEFPGVYVTRKNGIRGVVGREYQLKIEVAGKKYFSKPTLLPAPPIVDSIYAVFNNAARPYDFGHDVFIKIKDRPNEVNYYMVRHSSFNEFMLEQPECGIGCPIPILRCWKYVQYPGVTLLTDKLTDGNVTTQYIETAPMDDIIDYATYVQVSSGSRELYNYWSQLDEQSRLTGSIFDKLPAQVTGNITSQDGQEILGYFAVSGLKELKYKFSRYYLTPLKKAEELSAYNADFRPRRKEFDCRGINDYEWDRKLLIYRRYILANNIGDKLPAWWYENKE